ncbi:MAG: tRNA (N(6)-L-threonylcarbamoyladenosine(37)-C(2))-methylthiotransferase MtaB [Tannerella sp.]|jgi:threonylcarbamoyladenosine tRNA methylthiotransferase MtaB|nr:tRNA (N(6)-L-threonylcarbamoyladenosine(37)-C(2))-methylthiotransferase MtaB [Tannerella sp.]
MTDARIFENRVAAYYTLGCKLNFAETSSIGQELAQHGIRTAVAGERADICVINTCSVTEQADRKCRQLIRHIHRLHPEAFIVATGCYAQLAPEAVARIEGVNLVLGNAQKADIIRHLDSNRAATPVVVSSPAADMRTFIPSCSAGDRTRHFLKVQDGCDYRCSYCTIPAARGRSRNGSIAALTAQADRAAREGGREIVLTGVNIGDFGKSTGETFIDLLRALDDVDGVARYRISSLEPNLITDEIIDFTAGSKRFAPHFHIPLQSGSDAVLRLMRRRYDTALFRRKVERIRNAMPRAFIGVDVIVGARGETDECFEESYAFIERLPVSQLHVFHYSERPGTPALDIRPIVPPAVGHLRSKRLMALSAMKWRRFCEAQCGQTADVLFEHTRRGEMMHGRTENYVKAEAPFRAEAVNRLTRIRLNGWNGDGTAMTCSFTDRHAP